jgi:ATP-dependent RNA helicase RhlE
MSFVELGLCEPLLRALSSEGYQSPTPIQREAIPHLLSGSDLLGCAQTGTGKTAAFALPLLHRMAQRPPAVRSRGRVIRALVLSPTRELASQIGESFQTYGQHLSHRSTTIFGGVSQVPQVRHLQRGVDTLIATPGRLRDLMEQGYVDLSHVETFILDEADRMLDLGFLPDVRRVIRTLPTRRQNVVFSATIPTGVEPLLREVLREPVQVRIAPVRATTELIEQSVYHVAQKQKLDLLVELLGDPQVARAIVFTRTKHGADRVTRNLSRAGLRAEAIHGNKSQSARQKTLLQFRSNRIQVLVATDLASRGIDVDGVSHVVNFELPQDPETYVHRIGRTGRAGATGTAISLCDVEERSQLRAIEREVRQKLRVVTELPEGATCNWTPQVVSASAETASRSGGGYGASRGNRTRSASRPGGSRSAGGRSGGSRASASRGTSRSAAGQGRPSGSPNSPKARRKRSNDAAARRL